MQLSRSLVGVVLVGLVAVACGGGSPTQGPGGATQGPGATVGDGVPGGADTSHGKITFQVTGPLETSGEYGFVPAASIFGGAAGSSLSFTNSIDNGTSLISIIIAQDGTVLVSYTSPEGQVPAAECTTSDWNIGGSEGSGKFDCTAAFTITAAGATLNGGRITGSFTARA